MRRFIVPAVVALAIASGCSSGHGGLPDVGSEVPATPVGSPDPGASAPNPVECAAVRNLLDDARPVFQGDAGASAQQRAKDAADFYNHLSVLLTVTNGIDPVSESIGSDAAHLEQDYTSLAADAGRGDAGAQAQDTDSVAGDVRALERDQPAFEAACGIPAVAPS